MNHDARVMNEKDLAHYRQLLVEKLNELAGDMWDLEGELAEIKPAHGEHRIARDHEEQGTLADQEQILHALGEQERREALEIIAALERIESGEYGVCERTGKPIGRKRLEAIPWTRYSIEAARELQG